MKFTGFVILPFGAGQKIERNHRAISCYISDCFLSLPPLLPWGSSSSEVLLPWELLGELRPTSHLSREPSGMGSAAPGSEERAPRLPGSPASCPTVSPHTAGCGPASARSGASGWWRPVHLGRDPVPCPKACCCPVACQPRGTGRDFLGSPLHLRQINWSPSQETHQLPGTLRAVHTAVLACRTHAKQSL